MKKTVGTFILYITYLMVLCGMLLLHIRRIDGETERIMATAELVLLFLFCIGILILYVKKQTNTEPGETVRNIKNSNYIDSYENFLEKVAGEGLSEREKEVAWLIYRGFTNRQIAEELFIAETTVKKHVSHIFEKCGVSGRKELKERWRK